MAGAKCMHTLMASLDSDIDADILGYESDDEKWSSDESEIEQDPGQCFSMQLAACGVGGDHDAYTVTWSHQSTSTVFVPQRLSRVLGHASIKLTLVVSREISGFQMVLVGSTSDLDEYVGEHDFGLFVPKWITQSETVVYVDVV
jgi:hypothetical protein